MVSLTKESKELVARGYAITATETTFADHELEQALEAETFHYQREILDMASRHAHERDMLRREHLERVVAITGDGE